MAVIHDGAMGRWLEWEMGQMGVSKRKSVDLTIGYTTKTKKQQKLFLLITQQSEPPVRVQC